MSAAAETSTENRYIALAPGDPAPWFHQRSTTNPRYVFDTAAGRYIVLCFFVSAGTPEAQAAIEAVEANRRFFDDENACFFGVTLDPADERRVKESIPGLRYFLDFDGSVSRLYGAVPIGVTSGKVQARPLWIVLDPTLHVMAVFPFAPDGSDRQAVFDFLGTLPPPERFAGFEIPAPVLILPNVFERDLCRHLIGLYEAHGGEESGFMRDVDGKTVLVHDHGHKRRKDYTITEQGLIRTIQSRIMRRINPELLKIFAFKATRMERYIVSCYSADDGGHFRAHRDNTTLGTAHRRFAVSINLNSEFQGGEVSFPEYGKRSYKAPAGGAVVFPCAILHQVSKVGEGRRYAFLPFIYDDAAAKIREENNKHLGEGVGEYRAGPATVN
jgi:predicted 2-oxoglutarate/Fe(II)-dependent dioxygenase YbiX/peroxiredoxin